MKRFSVVPPGGGTSYDWTQDHTFVKVSSADTGGAFTLMEDNLKREFALGLHVHRQHAETFYILEGNVAFYIDGDWMTASPATTIHIPPGVPHAVTLPGGQTGKMLMIFQPSGFDQYLAELARMTEQDFADKQRMQQLGERFDIIALGGVPPRG
jgi:quercetin dioxygenase-like cupin family protein